QRQMCIRDSKVPGTCLQRRASVSLRPIHTNRVPSPPAGLKELLDRLALSTDASYLKLDPLEIVRRYEDPLDIEIAGMFACGLALGRADLIRKAASDALERMSPSPGRFIRNYDPVRKGGAFRGFVYRFFREADLDLLSLRLGNAVREHGTLGRFFAKGYSPDHADIGPALSSFVRGLSGSDRAPGGVEGPVPKSLRQAMGPRSGLRHFLADPADGSACKRLNLYLRWMVRKDGLDFGIWSGIPASKLVIPLDTHVARIGRRLGLTARSAADWKMAIEITEVLRGFDPEDPVKYDFALCTAGKLQACPDPPDRGACPECPFRGFCVEKNGTRIERI
ncbi:MAG: TIGR02757 family protein, partial [bacterium]|nr:TIGR02757 family protein [bacterium]